MHLMRLFVLNYSSIDHNDGKGELNISYSCILISIQFTSLSSLATLATSTLDIHMLHTYATLTHQLTFFPFSMRIYSNFRTKDFYAPATSVSFLVLLAFILFTLIIPFFISYWTGNLWLKQISYKSQPNVIYMQKYDIELLKNYEIIDIFPVVKTSEIDLNLDNIYDYFSYKIIIPSSAANVINITFYFNINNENKSLNIYENSAFSISYLRTYGSIFLLNDYIYNYKKSLKFGNNSAVIEGEIHFDELNYTRIPTELELFKNVYIQYISFLIPISLLSYIVYGILIKSGMVVATERGEGSGGFIKNKF